MRKHTLFAMWLCAAVSLGAASKADAGQTQAQPQKTRPLAVPPGLRPLSLNEGRAIVQEMAWADDEEGLAPDCSHLVHHLYEQAGYSYPYASSLDLYRGTGQFLRVRFPQPGDLIVWRGHVGIVVNPKEHSFFSSVTSGTQIENYRSAYWRARGYARFYRYLTSTPLKSTGKTTEAANRPSEPQPKAQPHRPGAIDPPSDRPNLQAVKTAPAGANKPPIEAKLSKAHAEAAPVNTTRVDDPLQIPLRTRGHPPKAADVTAALQAANLEAGEVLRAGNLEQLEKPVVVYRQLQVSGVELKGKRGTAQIQVETVATLTLEHMESQLGWEDHQLELQRTKKGWVMTPADQNVYVPREGAMRILAERLAALTQSAERSTEKDREQADIVRFMSLLVE